MDAPALRDEPEQTLDAANPEPAAVAAGRQPGFLPLQLCSQKHWDPKFCRECLKHSKGGF